jgi:methionine sulfoxide reductase heme-binding subunit
MLNGNEIPWAWYISRSSALVGFLLLYISIFLGLSIRTPLLKKIISPVYSANVHCWISLQALFFAFVHGVALLFDKFINFSLAEIFIPFASSYEPTLVALGILGFYLMLILVVTSYSKNFISEKLWRAVHFSNILLYIIVIIHAIKLGTDMKVPVVLNIFIWANAFLFFLILVNIISRLIDAYKRKFTDMQL